MLSEVYIESSRIMIMKRSRPAEQIEPVPQQPHQGEAKRSVFCPCSHSVHSWLKLAFLFGLRMNYCNDEHYLYILFKISDFDLTKGHLLSAV